MVKENFIDYKVNYLDFNIKNKSSNLKVNFLDLPSLRYRNTSKDKTCMFIWKKTKEPI